MKRRDVPAHLRAGYFWRWLRGGVWLHSIYGWTRVTAKEPARLDSVLWLGARPDWHMEDHRRAKQARPQTTEKL